MERLRLAVWQCEQQAEAVVENLARLREAALAAAAGGAALLVCPEMIVTGYAIDAEAVRRLAEPADGPSTQAVSRIAREAGLAIVWGFAERAEDGALFNSAQAVDAEGRSLGVYRKTHLFGELDRARFSASDGTSTIFELGGWRVGLLICYDVEFPEAVRGLALQGVDLVVVPTANMVGFEVVTDVLLPARACENGCFVAYANCCGREAGLHYAGHSAVAGPDGRLLVRAQALPALLTAELDRLALIGSPLDYLADRRPETYSALTRPKP